MVFELEIEFETGQGMEFVIELIDILVVALLPPLHS